MRLAYTTSPGRGDMDTVLARVTERLEGRGLRVLGVVQINTACEDDRPCDMDVKVLPDGPLIRISQSLGPQSRGCRLDPQGLEQAVGETAARLAGGGDVLMINKFGKQEAEGRGFRDVIAEALAAGMAVIVGVNGLNLPAFLDFCGDMATRLPADVEAIAAWADAAVATVSEDA